MPRKSARKKRTIVKKDIPQEIVQEVAQIEPELIPETDKTEPALEHKKKSFFSSRMAIIVGVVVLIIILLPAAYFYNQYLKSQKTIKNPTSVAQEDAKQLIASVGKLIELPQNEMPTIATVSDKTKLAGQAFFTKAENGDRVLIYANIKRAILYRPSINKLIEVAPIALQDNALQPGSSATPSPTPAPVKVLILNGTNSIGLTTKAETQLKSQIKNIDVVDRDNAKKRTYEKTIVIDVKGLGGTAINSLAKAIGGTISSLPDGEATPLNADYLIILGKDFVK